MIEPAPAAEPVIEPAPVAEPVAAPAPAVEPVVVAVPEIPELPAAEAPARFSQGYVLVPADTLVYRAADGRELAGAFTAQSAAYARVGTLTDSFANDWLKLSFDTADARERNAAFPAVYVQGRFVTALGEEEARQLTESLRLDPAIRYEGELPLPLAAFLAAERPSAEPEAKATMLAAPRVTNYSDQQTVPAAVWSAGLSISWEGVEHASGYSYAVKLLNGAPGVNSDAGTIVANGSLSAPQALQVAAAKLQGGKWLKIYLQAQPASGYSANGMAIYVYLQDASELTPPALNYMDRGQISYDLWHENSLIVTWDPVEGAAAYAYAVKLLNGAPGENNDAGTLLANKSGLTAPADVLIPADKLSAGKWVKVWVQASGQGKKAGERVTYLKMLSAGPLPAPQITPYADRAEVSFDDWCQGLTVTWDSVNPNAAYNYAVKLLNGEPGANNDAGTIVTSKSGLAAPEQLVIPAAKLSAGKWIKVFVQASAQDYTASSTAIYLKLGMPAPLAAPVIAGYADRDEVPASVWNAGQLSITWNAVTNADTYNYAIKLLTGAPGGNDAGTILSSANGVAAPAQIPVSASLLGDGKWIKVFVQANSTKGAAPASTVIYLKMAPAPALDAPVPNYTDRQTITADLWQNGLPVSWADVANADSYSYAVKLLNGEPGANNDAGTLLQNGALSAPEQITIPAAKLTLNKWVKIFVQATSTQGYKPASTVIYVKLGTIALEAPVAADYADRDTVDFEVWSKDQLIISWPAVTNATSYNAVVKLLSGEPGVNGDAGTIVINKSGLTAPEQIPVPAAKLSANKWIKVYLLAANTAAGATADKVIYLKLGTTTLAAPVIADYADRDEVPATVWNADQLKIAWDAVANADQYTAVVKLLNGEPGANGDAGTVLINKTGLTAPEQIAVPAAKLAEGKWIKVFLQASSAKGAAAGSSVTYLKMDAIPVLDAPVPNYTDRQTIPADIWQDGLQVEWPAVANADSYSYAVKLLNGEPGVNGDAGTLLKNGALTAPEQITIPAAKLTVHKWVKIYVQAISAQGYKANAATIYVKLGTIALDPPVAADYADRDTVDYTVWHAGQLNITWAAVTNATSYNAVVKLLNGEPGVNGDAGTILINKSGLTAPEQINVPAAKLAANKWIKVYLVAANTAAEASADKAIYLRMGQIQPLAAPEITSHADGDEIAYAEWSAQPLTVTWNAVENAASYNWVVKKLNGTPGQNNDDGTVLATGEGADTETDAIDLSDLAEGAYLKIFVQAKAPEYTAAGAFIYLHLGEKIIPVLTVEAEGLKGHTLTLPNDMAAGDTIALKITSDYDWVATLSQDTLVTFASAPEDSATVISDTEASGTANSALYLLLRMVQPTQIGTSTIVDLIFGSGDEEISYGIVQYIPAMTVKTITADRASTTEGHNITWTAEIADAIGAVTYQWEILQGETVIDTITGTENTLTHAADAAGTYTVKVTVTDAAQQTAEQTGGAVAVQADGTTLASLFTYETQNDGTVWITGYLGTELVQELVLPTQSPDYINITGIAPGAFRENLALNSIVLSAGITTVGDHAFDGCTALRSVTLSAALTSIGSYAFSDCSALPQIALPAGLTSLGTYAFQRCTALPGVTIPAGITAIPEGAFTGCSALRSVTLSDYVTVIGKAAFKDCGQLATMTIQN